MKIYIKSSNFGKDFDVFMLMEYVPDSGENGMEGDRFHCYGKFFADSLDSAKSDLQSVKSKYPHINFDGIYVSEYNEHFDDKSEDPYYGMPEVYPNLTTLLDSISNQDSDNSELPFDF